MAKIFDCFTFFNELRVLELRLKTHWDSVDKFVVTEATKTFRGKPKPLNLLDAKERFLPYWDKIEYVVVDDMPDDATSWQRETFQRNALSRGLKHAAPDDTIILSDLDELLRPEVLSALKARRLGDTDILCFELDWYAYYLNLLQARKWIRQSPRAIKASSLTDMQTLRMVGNKTKPFTKDIVRALKTARAFGRVMNRETVHDAGWHFTWLGGAEAVVDKVQAISTHSGMKVSDESLSTQTLEGLQRAMRGEDGYSVVPIDARFPSGITDDLAGWDDMILKP